VLKEDLAGAIEIIQSILQQANTSIAREEREDALLDLNDRVEDWKSLRVDSFGELMLFGTFSVQKGDGGGKDQEKEVGFPSYSSIPQ
jgi:cell division control protein 24